MKRPRAILLEAVSSEPQAESTEASLPEQDTQLHLIGAKRDWDIVDIILVDGFSRVYYTYREFAEDALKKGKPAPMRMFDHWAKKDFDVFAVSSGDRFGREQSIFAEVVLRTIDSGATVFTLRDGDIHKGNYRMFVSMAGYSAAGEIDELKRRRRVGMAKNARQGLPTSSGGHILSHTVIQIGKDDYQTVVNDSARRLFADIAEFLLAGVSWRQMPFLLAERGHYRQSGRRMSPSTLAKLLMHPTLWGNSAQHFSDRDGHTVGRGLWVFDAHEPHPEYVTIHYGTHPPMYQGVLAERVKAELRRRFHPGSAEPQPRRKFGGLVVCNQCHYAAHYNEKRGWLALRCSSRLQAELFTDCTNRRYVNEKKLIQAAKELLADLVASGDWSALYGEETQDDTAQRLALIEQELADIDRQADELFGQRGSVPMRFQDRFKAEMDRLDIQAEALQVEQGRLTYFMQTKAPDASQVQALADYAELTPDAFWQQPSLDINQWLTRIMGNYRFVIDQGEVIGTAPQPRNYQRKP